MSDIDNKSSDNVSAQDIVSLVKQSVYEILDALAIYEKTTLKDMIDKVVAKNQIQVSIANGLVPMITHEWAELGFGTVEKGRGGGVFKGGKRQKIDARPRCETCHQVVRPIGIKKMM